MFKAGKETFECFNQLFLEDCKNSALSYFNLKQQKNYGGGGGRTIGGFSRAGFGGPNNNRSREFYFSKSNEGIISSRNYDNNLLPGGGKASKAGSAHNIRDPPNINRLKFESDYDFEKANEQFQEALQNLGFKLKTSKIEGNILHQTYLFTRYFFQTRIRPMTIKSQQSKKPILTKMKISQFPTIKTMRTSECSTIEVHLSLTAFLARPKLKSKGNSKNIRKEKEFFQQRIESP